MMERKHTDSHFDTELKQLTDSILKMGHLVQGMIANSMKALLDRNSNLAEEVIRTDDQVNKLEVYVDDLCLKLIALRQPKARDLRFVTIGLRASTDLERMGDLAVNISERVVLLNKEAQLKPYVDLPDVAQKTQDMVKNALDALVKKDVGLANKVCESDDEVDGLTHKIYDDLIATMQKDPSAVSRGACLILICRHFERIADHATNIAEQVIFFVEGKDIRHGRL